MEEKEIVQSLRICSHRTDVQACTECPLFDSEDCMGDMMAGAADLIERLTAENVVLPDGQASAIESLRKEIEWKDMVIALAQKEQAKAEPRQIQRIRSTERMGNGKRNSTIFPEHS